MSDFRAWYARAPRIEERWIAGAAFLVDPATDALFQLNVTAAALWRLLEQPTDLSVAARLLADAFPGIPAARIRADVDAVIADLERRGLAMRCEPGTGPAAPAAVGGSTVRTPR
jgi:hypothetical protein